MTRRQLFIYRLGQVMAAAIRWLFWRLRMGFLSLSWVGRAIAIAVTIYTLGYVAGLLGAEGAAASLGRAGVFILAVLATGWVIRSIWRNHAGRPRGR
jgi:hypothetical protein